MRRPQAVVTALAVLVFLIPASAGADADGRAGGGSHHDSLHFSHPLFAESPSPDTKVRTDYLFRNVTGEEKAETHTARFEAEYAFRPWISLEADVPFTIRNPDDGSSVNDLDTVEVALKLASFVLAEHGVLLGGGIELGLPTGDAGKGIGSSHVVEVEPFVDFGFQRGGLEVVGFLSTGIPTNKNGDPEADIELGWNLSMLWHLHRCIQLIVELDGGRIFGGEERGLSTASISPGIKIAPFTDPNLRVGAGVSLPISHDKDQRSRALLSMFYHF